jgi:hypothetical protein
VVRGGGGPSYRPAAAALFDGGIHPGANCGQDGCSESFVAAFLSRFRSSFRREARTSQPRPARVVSAPRFGTSGAGGPRLRPSRAGRSIGSRSWIRGPTPNGVPSCQDRRLRTEPGQSSSGISLLPARGASRGPHPITGRASNRPARRFLARPSPRHDAPRLTTVAACIHAPKS